MTGTTQTVGSSDEERESSEPLLAPDQILDGTYRIRSMLGAGGMGQVFSARDLNLDCDVAIKVSWPHVPRGNLRREGMALAALRHPGLVAVYAMGHHKGLDYLVMERLYGLSLHDHLYHRGKAHPFSVAEGLEVLIGVADTLAVIHRGGYVHRDLKPGNIMLAPGHRIVLFDLGISLRADQAVKIERLAGSPHYMAPEAITMSIAQDQGHLIDIYALGVIAYEMLSGRRPFEPNSATAVLDMQLYSTPPRLDEDVPEPLRRLVAEMMRKAPQDRPQSVEAVGTWLRAIRSGQNDTRVAGNAISVLIADDDDDVRSLLVALVAQTLPEAQIRSVSDGMQAQQEILKSVPDLILLDLNMPNLSGLELCMYLRGTSLAANTSIAVVSGEVNADDRTLLKKLGVLTIIDKGSSSDNILGPLVRLMRDTQRLHSQLRSI